MVRTQPFQHDILAQGEFALECNESGGVDLAGDSHVEVNDPFFAPGYVVTVFESGLELAYHELPECE